MFENHEIINNVVLTFIDLIEEKVMIAESIATKIGEGFGTF